MKNYLNQKGSLPIVLIIVFVMTMSVVALTTLHISEQINLSYSATKDAEHMYKRDAVLEMTLHAFQQVLKAKQIDEAGGEDVLTSEDFALLEKLVNEDILPDYRLEDYKVFIEDESLLPTVDYFCITHSDLTNETSREYECLKETFAIRLFLQIEEKGSIRSFILETTDLYLETTEDKQLIFINTTDAQYALKKE